MSLPPGPVMPPWRQLIQWLRNPLGYLESAHESYGDVFTGRFGGNLPPFVLVSNPEAIREIFSADGKLFDSGRSNGLLKVLFGETSILLLDGENHHRQRRLLAPPFHGERMKSYGETICEIARDVSNSWSEGQPFDLRKDMQEITMSLILQVVFGLEKGARYKQLKQLLGQMLDMLGSPLSASMLFLEFLQQDLGPWSPWGRFVRRQRSMEELLYAEIREKREAADPNRTDILSLMISARDESGESMTDIELRDALVTLLVAGHETTATALTWALYWIQTIPEVREKILAEIDGLGPNPSPVDITRLPYLTAVCQETLRIYPVGIITLGRIANCDVTVADRKFSAGTVMAPCIYLVHHREDLYPQPKQFRPERFIGRQFAPYEYLPFGGGGRICIGMALAFFEMKLVLATILSRYELALENKHPIRPQRRGLTLAPSRIQMAVTGQRQRQSHPAAAV